MAPVPVNQLVVSPALGVLSLVDGLAFPTASRHTLTSQGRDHCGVNGQLLAAPERKAVRDDIDSSLVRHWHHCVQFGEQLVLLHPSACFPTDASHTNFRGGPLRFQQADP